MKSLRDFKTNFIIAFVVLLPACGAISVKLAPKMAEKLPLYPGPCSITDVEKKTTQKFEYGKYKRISRMSGPGFSAAYTYDDRGNITSKHISNRMMDATFQYTWDEFNNVTHIKYTPVASPEKSLAYVIELEYAGNPLDSAPVMAVNYDKDGFPNAHFFEVRFNIALLALSGDMTVTKKIQVDDSGRPVTITVQRKNSDGAGCEPGTVKVTYNDKGLVKKIAQTNGIYPEHPDVREFTYDDAHRPVLIVDSIWGDGTYYKKSIEHTYDSAGNTLSVREFEEGNTVRFEKYDYSCWAP